MVQRNILAAFQLAVLIVRTYAIVSTRNPRNMLSHHEAISNDHEISPSRTVYSIDCSPTNSDLLRSTVQKHVTKLDRYLQCKPISSHTRNAFENLRSRIDLSKRKVVMDSGCGTGRSSLRLGAMYPDYTILGIDRSIHRLSHNHEWNEDDSNTVQHVASNVWLVRADLVDFWRCCLDKDVAIFAHYLLYPNPYPKKSRLQNRWYAHPSFPLILELQSESLTVRSNWKQYLIEFQDSIGYAAGAYEDCHPGLNYARPYANGGNEIVLLSPNTIDSALTNFERKFWAAGEPTYELFFRSTV